MKNPSSEPPVPIKQTSFPTAAGILAIIAGALNFIAGLTVAAIGGAIANTAGWWHWAWQFGAIPNVPNVMGVIGALLIVIGIIAIVGGIFALKRRVWGMALAGAIFAWGVLGLLSIIFVSISRKEFE